MGHAGSPQATRSSIDETATRTVATLRRPRRSREAPALLRQATRRWHAWTNVVAGPELAVLTRRHHPNAVTNTLEPEAASPSVHRRPLVEPLPHEPVHGAALRSWVASEERLASPLETARPELGGACRRKDDSVAANHHEQDDHHDQLDQGAPAKPAAQAPQRAHTRRSRCHPRSMPSHPPTRFTMGANSIKGVAHRIGLLMALAPPTNRHLLTSPESPRQATTSPNSFVHLRALGAFVRDQGHTGNNEGRNEKRPTTGPGVSIGTEAELSSPRRPHHPRRRPRRRRPGPWPPGRRRGRR